MKKQNTCFLVSILTESVDADRFVTKYNIDVHSNNTQYMSIWLSIALSQRNLPYLRNESFREDATILLVYI